MTSRSDHFLSSTTLESAVASNMDPAFVLTSSFAGTSSRDSAPLRSARAKPRYARTPNRRALRATLEAPIEADQGADVMSWTSAETMSKSSTIWPAVLGIESVMKVLPHRYPFLLIDRVVAYEPGKRAIAIKNVSVNEPFFNGHFPGRPIMPGVLQVEALAQVCGIVMLQPPISDGKGDFFFGGVDGVRWRKPVVPGDTLVMEVELKTYKKRFGIAKMSGRAYVDGKLAVEGEFTLAMVVEK